MKENKKTRLPVFLIVLVVISSVFILTASGTASIATLKSGDSGEEVYAVQSRLYDLGYLNYRPTGNFSDMTVQAVQKFQQLNDLTASGEIDQTTKQALFSGTAKRNASNPAFKVLSGPGYNGEIKRKGLLSSWETIDKIFPVGASAKITDYNSETTFNVKRVGGVNCAQVVTETEDDFDSYTYAFGGETWEHRAVLVSIDGTEYAASLFGMPTNTEALNTSGMNGYTILYFNNSRTDINSIGDEEHSIAITRVS